MNSLRDLVNIFIDLLKMLVPILVGLALVVFFVGLAKFILRVGGDEKAVTEGKNLMIWGIIALFAMVSIWGILAFVYTDLGFDSAKSFGIPFFRTQ